jgi:ribosomal protein L32
MKYSNILIFRMVVRGLLIFFGVFFLFTIPFYWLNTGMLGIPVIMMIGGGITLAIASPIDFSIKSKRRKKLNSISQSDVIKMFECPQCGTIGATYFIKLVKDQILIKQRCPKHGGRFFRLPIRLKDESITHFRNTIFLCSKCGQVATEVNVKFSGPWTLINLSCITHGISLPPHKIWGTVYNEIIKDIETAPQPTKLTHIINKKKQFCPNCGENYLSPDQTICKNCGSER